MEKKNGEPKPETQWKKKRSLCWREQKVWPWDPCMCVYLPKYHENSVLITWKHLKYVSSFHNSSLKDQRIEQWKQKLKTHPNKLFNYGTHQFWVMNNENKLFSCGTHQFWVMNNKNRIMDDENCKSKKKKKGQLVLERAKGLIVGPMYVCLFTKMPWKLSFNNLKIPKICFQFT